MLEMIYSKACLGIPYHAHKIRNCLRIDEIKKLFGHLKV